MSLGSFWYAWVHSDANIGGRVHSSSPGFTLALLNVAEFILVRVGSLGRTRSRRVQSGSRGLSRARLWVVRLIQVHLGSLHWCSLGFTHESLGVSGFARDCVGSLRP